MNLSPRHTSLLDRLCLAAENGAFDDGCEVLYELGSQPTPLLIPALLPAFVPRTLRGLQSRRAPGERTWSDEIPLEEAVFRDELVRTLGACLARAQARDLVVLDEQSRGSGGSRWRPNHWHGLDAEEFMRWLPAQPELRFVVVALATFHVSGYVRERAIALLSTMRSGAELPFLLIRLNDWAAPVQQRAHHAVRERLREEYVPHFARWLVLLRRLGEARRNNLADIVQRATTLVFNPADLAALVALYEAPDRQLRRAAFELAIERLEAHDREEALVRALRDPDAGIRIWAARIACEAGKHLAQLAWDPCGVIRVWSLRARVERADHDVIPSLHRALFDRAASVRAVARFHLARLEPSFSVVEDYRRALETEGDPSLLSSAIAGLGEIGNRDDAALVSFHIRAPSSRVAKAAIVSCAKLARAECQRDLLQALGDPRLGVSQVAQRVLAKGPLVLSLLVDMLRSAEHTHTALYAIALAVSFERWNRLILFLHAAAHHQPAVRQAAHDAISRWLRTLDHGLYRRTPPRADQQTWARSLLSNCADPVLREQIERTLA